MRCTRANGGSRQRRGQEAGTVPPTHPDRLTAGVGGRRLGPEQGGGSGLHQEGLRQPQWLHSPWRLRTPESPPLAMEPKDSVDGGGGLWLRTWRRTRPASSAAASAPASSRGPGSDAHAQRGPLRRPPVSRTAQPSQQPPACASRRAHARRPRGLLPPLRPLGAAAETPGRALSRGSARLLSSAVQSAPVRGAEPWEH